MLQEKKLPSIEKKVLENAEYFSCNFLTGLNSLIAVGAQKWGPDGAPKWRHRWGSGKTREGVIYHQSRTAVGVIR